MDFISNQEPQIQEMLAALGLEKCEDLFASIPQSLILPKPTNDDGISEYEGKKWMEHLSSWSQYALN